MIVGAMDDNIRFPGSMAFALLWLLTLTIPIESVLNIPGFGTVARAVGIIAFVSGVMAVLARGQARSLRAIHLLMAGFALWVALSSIWSIDVDVTYTRLFTTAQLLALAWLVCELADDLEKLGMLLQAYVLGSSLAAIGVIHSFLTGNPSMLHWSVERFGAFGMDLNDMALTIALAIPMAAYLATEPLHLRYLSWTTRLSLSLPLLLLAIVLTGSRTGAIAGVVALISVPLFYVSIELRRQVGLVVVILISVYALATLTPLSLWNRFATIASELSGGDIGNRRYLWTAGLRVFLERPFLGAGAGAHESAVAPYIGSRLANVAHNSFLSVLVEEGVVGFAFFTGIVFALLFRTRQLLSGDRRLAIAILATWTVGVQALTWEFDKSTWFLFATLAAWPLAHLSASRDRQVDSAVESTSVC